MLDVITRCSLHLVYITIFMSSWIGCNGFATEDVCGPYTALTFEQHLMHQHQQNHRTSYMNMDGNDWAVITFSENKTVRMISLQFKTRDADQILWSFHLHGQGPGMPNPVVSKAVVFLTSGRMELKLESHSLEHAQQALDCVSDYKTCADTRWHVAVFHVEYNYLFISLDSKKPIKKTIIENPIEFGISSINLGNMVKISQTGAPGISLNLLRKPFRGCIGNIFYSDGKGETLLNYRNNVTAHFEASKDLLQKDCNSTNILPAKTSPRPSSLHRRSPDTISFTRKGSLIQVNGWSITSHAELSFHLRTTINDGLILFASSIHDFELQEKSGSDLAIANAGQAGFDIFAIEMHDGHLIVTVNTGAGAIRIGSHRARSRDLSINDGKWHQVDIRFHEGNMILHIDRVSLEQYTSDKQLYKYLNLNGIFYLGGLSSNIRRIVSAIAPEVLSAHLNRYYLGCLRNLTVNGIPWDLDLELRSCRTAPGIKPVCKSSSQFSTCTDHFCFNGGQCYQEWNRVKCDCSQNNFRGDRCNEAPLLLSFDGHQWIHVQLGHFPIESPAESLLIRFKTRQIWNGLLFTTRSMYVAASDCLELRINAGHLLLIYDFGDGPKAYKNVLYVADDEWHSVYVTRKERFLNFTIDNVSQIYDIKNDGKFLSLNRIILGQNAVYADGHLRHKFNSSSNSSFMWMSFVGQVSKFEFNGINYLEAGHSLDDAPHSVIHPIEITAKKIQMNSLLLDFPVTLTQPGSHVDLFLPMNTAEFRLEFMVKVNKNFGTLCRFLGNGRELLAVAIVDGYWQVVYLDNMGVQRVVSARPTISVGSQWHYMRMYRNDSLRDSIVIHIDDDVLQLSQFGMTRGETYKLQFGSHQARSLENSTSSQDSGFSGCIASLVVNISHAEHKGLRTEQYSRVTMYSDGSGLFKWANIQPGCDLPVSSEKVNYHNYCNSNICQFGGRCVQQLGATRCDCSMTSFSGKLCSEVTETLQLSSEEGSFVTYEIKPPQNNTRDRLAFGIQTNSTKQMDLFTFYGSDLHSDFIQVALIESKRQKRMVVIRFNMGAGLHTLYEHEVNIADGHYHVIQFYRDGNKGRLVVDFKHERQIRSKGDRGMHFNNIQYIKIGSSRKTKTPGERIEEKKLSDRIQHEANVFISGISFNGLDLIQVLKGLVIPGIFVSEQANVQVKSKWRPNLGNLFEQKTDSELLNHHVANDMQNQPANENTMQTHEFHSKRLIVPRIQCPDPSAIHQLKSCRPATDDGLIRPVLSWKNTVSENKWTEHNGNWNADQSKSRQPHPNDYSAVVPPPIPEAPNHLSMNTMKSESIIESRKELYASNMDKKPYDEDGVPKFGIEEPKGLAFNIGLIACVSITGICVVFLLTCVIYRLMRRDEGSYNAQDGVNYTGNRPNDNVNQRNTLISRHQAQPISSSSPMVEKYQTPSGDEFSSPVPGNQTPLSQAGLKNSPAPTFSGTDNKRRSQLVKIDSPRNQIGRSPKKIKQSPVSTNSHEWFV